jgi:predicted SAM-dependent methyltransferase
VEVDLKKLKKIYRQTMRRWTWGLFRRRRILNTKVEDLITDNLKLHLGCGDKKLAGYINIDMVPREGADVIMDVAEELYLIPSDIAVEIRLESVFEHFYRYQQRKILQEFYRILKAGGKLVIRRLPDFDAVIDAYLKKEKGIVGESFDLFNVYRFSHGDPKPGNSPQQLHKDIFTKESIRELLESIGFQIENIKHEKLDIEDLILNINIIAQKQ